MKSHLSERHLQKLGSLPSRERGLKYTQFFRFINSFAVAPLAGAWIEMRTIFVRCALCIVAPLAGAWIEMSLMSYCCTVGGVAPLAGAWIEIKKNQSPDYSAFVAPLAGAWIEMIVVYHVAFGLFKSLPSRERGLKSYV